MKKWVLIRFRVNLLQLVFDFCDFPVLNVCSHMHIVLFIFTECDYFL